MHNDEKNKRKRSPDEEAKSILNRVREDAQNFLTRERRGAIDESDDDPKLLFWGRLIGRLLAVIFVLYLLVSIAQRLSS